MTVIDHSRTDDENLDLVRRFRSWMRFNQGVTDQELRALFEKALSTPAPKAPPFVRARKPQEAHP